MAFSPIVTFERIVEPEPIEAPRFTSVVSTLPVLFGLKSAVRRRRARIGVVDKGHAVADENVVFDRHALADKRVAGNLAAAAHAGIFLDLDERADLGFVADLAAVQVDELGELYAFSQLHIGRDRSRIRSQSHQLPSLLNRALGGFQHPHHAQAGVAVIEGSLAVA